MLHGSPTSSLIPRRTGTNKPNFCFIPAFITYVSPHAANPARILPHPADSHHNASYFPCTSLSSLLRSLPGDGAPPGISDGDSKVRFTRTAEAPFHVVCYRVVVYRGCSWQLAARGSTCVELLTTLAHIPVTNLLRTLCKPCRSPPHRLRTCIRQ